MMCATTNPGTSPSAETDHDAGEYHGLLAPVRSEKRSQPAPVDASFDLRFIGLIDVRPHQPVAGHHRASAERLPDGARLCCLP